jgi:hypothetical protein
MESFGGAAEGDGWRFVPGVRLDGWVSSTGGLEHARSIWADGGQPSLPVDIDEEIVVGAELLFSGSCPGRLAGLTFDDAEVRVDLDYERQLPLLGSVLCSGGGSAVVDGVFVIARAKVPKRFRFVAGPGRAITVNLKNPDAEKRQRWAHPTVVSYTQVTPVVAGRQKVIRMLWNDGTQDRKTTWLVGHTTGLTEPGLTKVGSISDPRPVTVTGYVADCDDTASCKANSPLQEPCTWTGTTDAFGTIYVMVSFEGDGCSISASSEPPP